MAHFFIPPQCVTLIIVITFLASTTVWATETSGVDVRKMNVAGEGEDQKLFQMFYDFAVEHKRSYIHYKNMTEILWRFQVYKESVSRIDGLNKPYKTSKANSAPVFGINKFADLTPEEFKATYLSSYIGDKHHLKQKNKFSPKGSPHVAVGQLPKVVDWRKKAVLSSVKDQKQCGACWAFSIAETLESMSAIEHNYTKVPDLSVQELIDCDTDNKGCTGGDICNAAKYAQAVGLVQASVYPLTRHTDSCKMPSRSAKRVKATSHECDNWTGQEEHILETLATHGPVAVAVDASTWHNYVGGVIRFHCSAHINHAVQIVGYNLEGDVPYYIIRNSWGKNFGDNGYLYIKYGGNLCGLAREVVKMSASKLE